MWDIFPTQICGTFAGHHLEGRRWRQEAFSRKCGEPQGPGGPAGLSWSGARGQVDRTLLGQPSAAREPLRGLQGEVFCAQA